MSLKIKERIVYQKITQNTLQKKILQSKLSEMKKNELLFAENLKKLLKESVVLNNSYNKDNIKRTLFSFNLIGKNKKNIDDLKVRQSDNKTKYNQLIEQLSNLGKIEEKLLEKKEEIINSKTNILESLEQENNQNVCVCNDLENNQISINQPDASQLNREVSYLSGNNFKVKEDSITTNEATIEKIEFVDQLTPLENDNFSQSHQFIEEVYNKIAEKDKREKKHQNSFKFEEDINYQEIENLKLCVTNNDLSEAIAKAEVDITLKNKNSRISSQDKVDVNLKLEGYQNFTKNVASIDSGYKNKLNKEIKNGLAFMYPESGNIRVFIN